MSKRGKGWLWRLRSGRNRRKKSPPVGAWAGGLRLAINPLFGEVYAFDFCNNVVSEGIAVKLCHLYKMAVTT